MADKDAVMQAMHNLEIGYAPGDNAGHVTRNIKLPATGENGVTIAWASDKPKIINTILPGTGIVTRPDDMHTDVTLTATPTKGRGVDTKTFLLTVIISEDAQAVREAIHSLAIVYAQGDSASSVAEDITLPLTGGEDHGEGGLTISWASDNAAIDVQTTPGTGIVTRDDDMHINVTLTATLTKGRVTDTKTFTLTVINLPFWSEVDLADDSSIWSARHFHETLVFGDKMWVMGGIASNISSTGFNDVWSSTDGATWTKATDAAGWSPRRGHAAVAFGSKIWVLGGIISTPLVPVTMNEVWSSTDGSAWTKAAVSGAQWTPRRGHTAVVFGGKMWILGGDDGIGQLNDVWWSSDGTTWTKTTVSGTHWSTRTNHAAVVFDEKMWVLGGFGGGYKNDVWWSSDGAAWTETAVMGTHWSARQQHAMVVFDGKMWVMGGIDAGGRRLNDVWWSADGSNWTKLSNGAPHWLPRGGHASVVLNDKIFLIGGNGIRGWKNDVWVYQQTN